MAVNTLGNTFSNFQGTHMPMPGVLSPMTPNLQGKLKVDEEGIYGAKGSLQMPVNKDKTISVGGQADVNFPFTGEGQDPFGGSFTYQNPGTVQTPFKFVVDRFHPTFLCRSPKPPKPAKPHRSRLTRAF